MSKKRAKKKRHLVVNVQENEPITVFDIFSRFELELKLIQKPSGQTAIDFYVPGNMRIAK